mmetsp:Transcript_13750/g.29651  ORF Transcript_13750/g.29651 Transcript_13750/m.29651 type:complete len:273 (+) Transcript_13750:312-1130(+)
MRSAFVEPRKYASSYGHAASRSSYGDISALPVGHGWRGRGVLLLAMNTQNKGMEGARGGLFIKVGLACRTGGTFVSCWTKPSTQCFSVLHPRGLQIHPWAVPPYTSSARLHLQPAMGKAARRLSLVARIQTTGSISGGQYGCARTSSAFSPLEPATADISTTQVTLRNSAAGGVKSGGHLRSHRHTGATPHGWPSCARGLRRPPAASTCGTTMRCLPRASTLTLRRLSAGCRRCYAVRTKRARRCRSSALRHTYSNRSPPPRRCQWTRPSAS